MFLPDRVQLRDLKQTEGSISQWFESISEDLVFTLFGFYSKHFTYKIFFSFEIRSHSIAQVRLELIAILLPWPLVCWKHMNEPAYVFTYVVISELLYFSKSPLVICKMTQGKTVH